MRKPPRKTNVTVEMEEFAERYETLASIYGDPVEVCFALIANSLEKSETRLRAAEILISYRFPRLKAAENVPASGPVLNFTVVAQAPQPTPIEPGPARLALVEQKS